MLVHKVLLLSRHPKVRILMLKRFLSFLSHYRLLLVG